jgi:hypothetical protein
MKDASDTMESAKERHSENIRRFESENKSTSEMMDKLGKKEMEILASFSDFADVWAKIHNKPEFKAIEKGGLEMAQYSPQELKKVSVGAGVLLSGLGGALVGTGGAFAAAGATTAAVMALGTASTGTAIASLTGVAATNATLALLGGGTLAAGGGGMALGATILGASTLGVGLLIGGVIFSIAGSSISEKADKAYDEMLKAEQVIDDICAYLKDLKSAAGKYLHSLINVNARYEEWFGKLRDTVNDKTDWNDFFPEEKLNAENTVLSVGLLYEMCKVKFVLVSDSETKKNEINYPAIGVAMEKSAAFLQAVYR